MADSPFSSFSATPVARGPVSTEPTIESLRLQSLQEEVEALRLESKRSQREIPELRASMEAAAAAAKFVGRCLLFYFIFNKIYAVFYSRAHEAMIKEKYNNLKRAVRV